MLELRLDSRRIPPRLAAKRRRLLPSSLTLDGHGRDRFAYFAAEFLAASCSGGLHAFPRDKNCRMSASAEVTRKPSGMNTYKIVDHNQSRINTYKKMGWGRVGAIPNS